ncbi:MAG: beta-glucosidase [Bacteroidales bacterium]|jgi:hypothetical protein|nr:beta-glucosidase [Bacteroidales bacterium]
MKRFSILLTLFSVCISSTFTSACKEKDDDALEVIYCSINGVTLAEGQKTENIPSDTWRMEIAFDKAIDFSKINRSKIYFSNNLLNNNCTVSAHVSNNKALVFSGTTELPKNISCVLNINEGENLGGRITKNYQYGFTVQRDPVPQISDDSLLTLVQYRTFNYFWDYGHPVSGLARERTGSGNTVTSGGSGFGVMAILVGIERGFISRNQALERLTAIVSFLKNNANKFKGAFSHWLNGATGAAIAFSHSDNGGDLVETAFMIQGLLTVYEYFKNDASAASLCADIQELWRGVEWDWYRKGNENMLYWHWSPDKGWAMNMGIRGWNECLIAYVLAASSPTHTITKEVYDNGWAKNGAISNGKSFYDVVLPLGEDRGGPLFFTHYSFLGLNPHKISDRYADYWEQNTAHAQINYRYCAANPRGFAGYGPNCWGLTASDIPGGYTASSPNNDNGTIAPTAALASMPYTPVESMNALRHFYYNLGHDIWSDYGFKDAFNQTEDNWVAAGYLAIDQGPVVVMIENYRTGLLWNLFMQNTDVQAGLNKLGFTVQP